MEKGQTLPEYLKELRRSCRYKQEYVASKLNIARQTYSHYETGRIKPPAGTLHKLAHLYGISIEELFDCMEETKEGDRAGKQRLLHYTGAGRPENRFLRCFRELDERDRRDILSIMEMKIRNREEEAALKAAAYGKEEETECRA